MADPALARVPIPAVPAAPRHSALVRATHWITAVCFLALLVTGVEILISHPRFYWGETGNIHTRPLFIIPIPASRSAVPTGYGYVLPDQNGWSRALHFQTAWLLIFTGLLYVAWGMLTRHFRKNLLPGRNDLSASALSKVIADHLRLRTPRPSEAWAYNSLQQITYLVVVFTLFPLMIWTGLAMSPAFVSAFPSSAALLGGQQSARTIHFFVTLILVGFVAVHIAMVCLSGFKSRMRAMTIGQPDTTKEQA